MTYSPELPAVSAQRAREFVAEGRAPSAPRPASTVVLVRDGGRGVEVYVQHRRTSMAFAGGMVAFPGGGAEPSDAGFAVDIDARLWSERLGTPDAAHFVGAALRETLEETGIRLQAEQLVPWAHWITPRFEPLRFDTWFFLAELPDGQEPQDVSGEASKALWIAAAEAVARADGGEWLMLPPTRLVLEEISTFGCVADLKAAQRTQIPAIVPGWIDDGVSVHAVLPDDPRYPGDDPGDPPR